MNVTFETAKLANQKGFDLKSSNYWVKTLSGEIIHNSERMDTHEHERCIYYLSQPTQSELQTWLRDKHKIFVSVDFDPDYHKTSVYSADVRSLKVEDLGERLLDGFLLHTKYEEALEEGLSETLKTLNDAE